MKPVGGGVLNPTDPFVGFAFELSSTTGWAAARHELRLDNVHYASPAYYVSPKGKDANDGRTEQTPLATPQKAVELADNTVYQCSGAGVSVIQGDWAIVENNHIHGNCKWMIYAGSGISIYQAVNFDGAAGAYRMLVRHNRTHDNLCTQPWSAIGKISDGNGIIIDDFRNTQNKSKNGVYEGRTLVQGNLSYRNGGSGMHAYLSNGVDFINNTAWMNSASPELQYGQIFAQDCDDVRIVNNILVAPIANVSAGEKAETINGAGRCTNFVYAHNLYFGGNKRPLMGENDRIADPLFVNPSTDPAKADFRLRAGSPAVNAGRLESFSPIADLNGKLRPLNGSADLGAFQK